MAKHHACVWIDHLHAKVFHIEADGVSKEEQHDHGPNHHIHRKADHVGLGKMDIDPAFLAEVAAALEDAGAILIVGPGNARLVLAGYLQEHHRKTAGKIWGSEPIDHPTDPQIVAHARKFFVAAERMHA